MTISSFPATFNHTTGRPIVTKIRLFKALSLAAGLGLGMLSYPVHAASGRDTVQGPLRGATRHDEDLKNEGMDGLIAALNRKADILTGTTAKSF